VARRTAFGKLEGRCSHETLHRGLPSAVATLESITSHYPDSLVSAAQVSTADRLPANTTSAQPLWGEWPQDFWDRSEAAKEQEEDEAWCARLQAPQQPSQLTGGTAEVYDWGDWPACLMPGEVYGQPLHDTACPAPEQAAAPQTSATAHSPTTESEHCWLRHHDGQWQRKVLLNQLKHHDQFNGLTGWAAVDALEASAGGVPQLLRIHVDSLDRAVHVNSANVFLVSPNLLARPVDNSLIVIKTLLNVQEGAPPVPARLVVDSGCQLEGVLSTDFVRRQGWQAMPSSVNIRTADGRRLHGVNSIVANSHLAPGFTRPVTYGVLDLPGFDGLLGMGFLNQFQQFAITVTSDSQRHLTLTNPRNKQQVQIAGLEWSRWADNVAGERSPTPVAGDRDPSTLASPCKTSTRAFN